MCSFVQEAMKRPDMKFRSQKAVISVDFVQEPHSLVHSLSLIVMVSFEIGRS